MNILLMIGTLLVLAFAIFFVAWLRKRLNKHLKIELIDILVVGFIFAIILFLSGKITDFEVASMKIKATKDQAIAEIKEQQEIAMLWLKVFEAEEIQDPETAINDLQQILLKEENAQVYFHLGSAYEFLAYKYQNEEKKKELLFEARDYYIKAMELDNNYDFAAIYIAKAYAYLDKEEECKKWLKKAESSNKLPPHDDIFEFDYISKYSNKPWFKELKWREYK